ncbi:MAG: hypothetical protein DELT_01700 [Desulfovibrio sp.]
MNTEKINTETNNQYPVDKRIAKRVCQLLDHVCEKHNKILPVRFDVRYPSSYEATGDNEDISKMMAKFIQHYTRLNIDAHYFWVREQKSSPNPHYHCAVFLDGNKTLNKGHVFYNAEKYWNSTINSESDGLIDKCTKSKNGTPHANGIPLIRSSDSYAANREQVEGQMRYPCKQDGKGEAKDGLRNFGMSRLSKSEKS